MSSRRIWAIVVRHLYIWPRTLERLMWAFGWPFLDLFIWGLVSSYFQKTSRAEFSLVNMLLGGVIFWTMFWRSQNEISVNFLDEGWNKNLINLFATPLTWGEFLLATLILGLIKLVFTMASVTLAALIFYQFNFWSFGWATPILVFNLLFFAWIVGFFVTGLILRFGYTVAELAWGIMALIQPFSCVFYPLAALPVWAQKIALTLPSTYVFEEMRRILFTGQADWDKLLISFGLNCFYLVLVLKFFQWMYANARIHGRLIKLN